MHLYYRGVNDAFEGLVRGIHRGEFQVNASPSRYGDVLRLDGPVTITYTNPRERVLFNKARDCNSFFHLFESLWMLAGRNDIGSLCYYNSKMKEFSDDGFTIPDAYGHRWREYFGWDQLESIIDDLKKDKSSRRMVLQMWNSAKANHKFRFDNPDVSADTFRAASGSKSVPCNTQAYFDITNNELNMTVCNRSNDMIWGMLGANVVHFSFLQEYLACCIGVAVGKYHQFTNNLHVYINNFEPEKWLKEYLPRTETTLTYISSDRNGGFEPVETARALVIDQAVFDFEVKKFIDDPFKEWQEPFLEFVAKPMCCAFKHHKSRQYDLAREALERVTAGDWQMDGLRWINKREAMWKEKQKDAAPASVD